MFTLLHSYTTVPNFRSQRQALETRKFSNIFLFTEEYIYIANYADDANPHYCSYSTESVIEMLEISATELFQWFQNNNLKANANKCNLLLSTSES